MILTVNVGPEFSKHEAIRIFNTKIKIEFVSLESHLWSQSQIMTSYMRWKLTCYNLFWQEVALTAWHCCGCCYHLQATVWKQWRWKVLYTCYLPDYLHAWLETRCLTTKATSKRKWRNVTQGLIQTGWSNQQDKRNAIGWSNTWTRKEKIEYKTPDV